jgi:hypothetical protein
VPGIEADRPILRPEAARPSGMVPCIWCLHRKQSAPPEHIFPAALGCPDWFVLTDGECCEGCNKRMSRLDQAIFQNFEFLAVVSQIPNRDGKARTSMQHSNLVFGPSDTGPYLTVNMGTRAITDRIGRHIPAFRSDKRYGYRSRNIRDIGGGETAGEIEQTLRHDKTVCRGLHKIALSILTWFLGAHVAREARFDAARRFVRAGKGDRRVLARQAAEIEFALQIAQPCDDAVTFRLGWVHYTVDLLPGQDSIPIWQDRLRRESGDEGWGVVPLERDMPRKVQRIE